MTSPTPDVAATVAELRDLASLLARGQITQPRAAKKRIDRAADLLEHLEAERQNQAKALSEASERIAELEHGVSDQLEDAEYHKQKRLAAEAILAEASTHITDLANELSAEIEARYAGMLNYPSQKRKYDLDMDSVVSARSFLNAQEKA